MQRGTVTRGQPWRPWLAALPVAGGLAAALGVVWQVPDAWRAWTATGVIVLMAATLAARLICDLARRSGAEICELQDAMDALPDGVVIYDTDTRRVMMNRRFREIHAANPLGSDARAPLDEVLRAAIKAGELQVPANTDPETWIRERIAHHRSGSHEYFQHSRGRWIRILERRMRDGRMVAIHADISELKAAQEDAETANRAKSQFLASMSHELRTPLNAVLGFAQLLQSNRTQNLTEDQKDHVQRILSSGEHLLNLINEVLDLAGIEAGKLKLSLERVRLADVVHDLAGAMAPLAERAGVSLLTEAADADVRADQTRLRQVLFNLVSNAIKYNRENGSVRIEVARAPEERIRVSVSDTGRGIRAERRDKLFQPFQRLGAEEGGVEGTGIGLAISRRLIEAMGGTMGFDSQPGTGSTFWFELPAAGDEISKDRSDGTALQRLPYLSAGKRSILYVEDNPANLDLIERIFTALPNVTLLAAQTARAGLELAVTRRPDLIVLDITLPEMSGYDVLARLKLMPETKHIPVLALSALAMPQDISHGLAAGFSRYVTKPIDVNAFLAAVEESLHGSPVRHAVGGA
ncbi:MAG: response regulator [Alphaproteobacteria bacterium]|nr:response regulator [Alphaproteobacteria bacterium]